jgi:hypothetical protein
MLIRDFGALPCYAPETETGAAGTGTDAGAGGAAPPPGGAEGGAEPGTGTGGAEGEGEGQQEQRQEGRQARKSVRQELEGANEEIKKRKGRDQQGRFQGQEGQQQQPAEGQQQQEGQAQQQQTAAPEAWTKEAKAAWAQVPPTAQAAILKREQDMTAGVENLKKGYKELDDAIKPYMGAIQEHKTTPGAAVKQLFDWMNALTSEAQALKAGQPPKGVFAALAQSYGIDPVRLLAHMVQNPVQRQQQNGQQQQQPTGQLDPAIQAYLDQKLAPLGQNLNGLYQTVQQQSIAKTNEMLAMWAKDKPFYNDVRVTMARLMTPGANGEPPLVPAREDGNADLDTAYERACNMDPNVRAKMQAAAKDAETKAAADKAAAEKAAQKTKLEAARKASGSIPISAPGLPGDGKQQAKKRGETVGETLRKSIKEVADRAG